jgi:hypothetical protein
MEKCKVRETCEILLVHGVWVCVCLCVCVAVGEGNITSVTTVIAWQWQVACMSLHHRVQLFEVPSAGCHFTVSINSDIFHMCHIPNYFVKLIIVPGVSLCKYKTTLHSFILFFLISSSLNVLPNRCRCKE